MTDTPQNKTSESNTPILTVFDDHEIPFATLNNALSRLTSILEAPCTAKETFAPIKIKKEHVDFLAKETLMSKTEIECLLTRTSGDLPAAIKLYMDSPLDKSFKF